MKRLKDEIPRYTIKIRIKDGNKKGRKVKRKQRKGR